MSKGDINFVKNTFAYNNSTDHVRPDYQSYPRVLSEADLMERKAILANIIREKNLDFDVETEVAKYLNIQNLDIYQVLDKIVSQIRSDNAQGNDRRAEIQKIVMMLINITDPKKRLQVLKGLMIELVMGNDVIGLESPEIALLDVFVEEMRHAEDEVRRIEEIEAQEGQVDIATEVQDEYRSKQEEYLRELKDSIKEELDKLAKVKEETEALLTKSAVLEAKNRELEEEMFLLEESSAPLTENLQKIVDEQGGSDVSLRESFKKIEEEQQKRSDEFREKQSLIEEQIEALHDFYEAEKLRDELSENYKKYIDESLTIVEENDAEIVRLEEEIEVLEQDQEKEDRIDEVLARIEAKKEAKKQDWQDLKDQAIAKEVVEIVVEDADPVEVSVAKVESNLPNFDRLREFQEKFARIKAGEKVYDIEPGKTPSTSPFSNSEVHEKVKRGEVITGIPRSSVYDPSAGPAKNISDKFRGG